MPHPVYTPQAARICSPMSILHPPRRPGRRGHLQVLAMNTGFVSSKPPHTRSVAAMAFLAGPHGAALEQILGRYPHLGWHSAVMGERSSARTGARVLIYHIGTDELDHGDWFWLFLELRCYVRRCWPYGEFRIEASVADVDSFVREHRRGLIEEFPSMENWGGVGPAGRGIGGGTVKEDDVVEHNAERLATTNTTSIKEIVADQAPGRKSQERKEDTAERQIQQENEQQQAKQERDRRDYGQEEYEQVAADPELEAAAAVVEQATQQLLQHREEQTAVEGRKEAHEQVQRRVPLLRRVCSRERRKSLKNGILGVKRKLSWLGFGSLGRPRACPAEC